MSIRMYDLYAAINLDRSWRGVYVFVSVITWILILCCKFVSTYELR